VVAEEPPGPDPTDETPSALDELVPEFVEVFNKLVGLGAALTRTMAQAAAPESGGTGNGAIDEMVRNGATALANIVRLTVDSLRATTQPPAAPGQKVSEGRAAPRPQVHAGDTLRMPLFIENPSAGPTGPLQFGALDAVFPDSTGGRPLGLDQVRCAPKILEIGARDFEKLTVFVNTEPTTPIGRHRVQLGVPGTTFVTTIEFDVIAKQN
jgi:hypothetical protein